MFHFERVFRTYNGCVCICSIIYIKSKLYLCSNNPRISFIGSRPLSIRQAFLLAYLGINSMWKSISEKRQCSVKNRHNAQHNKHKNIRCATKRIKARPAALTTRLCLMHAKSEAYDT